jgi:hypothetical protein
MNQFLGVGQTFRLAVWMLLGAVTWFCLTTCRALAVGPSYDCAQAQTPMQKFICSSPALSKIDLEFVQPYYALRQQVGPSDWQSLKVDAVNFDDRMLQECGVAPSGELPTDRNALEQCVSNAYLAQKAQWRSQLHGAALEEASRPIEQHIALQARLQALGYLPNTATIDGVYGSATRDAISAWQKAAGRPVTGFIDDADAKLLLVVTASEVSLMAPSMPKGLVPMSQLAASYEQAHQK